MKTIAELISAGATIVDVRTPEEFRGGAYPKALNIPLNGLAGRLSEIPKDKAVVVYCAAGGRSAKAAALLTQAGYVEVVNGGGLKDMPK